jgi:hypothetical protein
MSTFDAISQIRRESLSRKEALRYLMVHLGVSAMYAEEIVSVIFGEATPSEKQIEAAAV